MFRIPSRGYNLWKIHLYLPNPSTGEFGNRFHVSAAPHPQSHPFSGGWIPIPRCLGPLPPQRGHQEVTNASLYWDWDHRAISGGQSLFWHIPRSIPRAVRLSRAAAASRSPWITTGIPPETPGRDKTHSAFIYWLPSLHLIPWESLGRSPQSSSGGLFHEIPL